ncbi:MAG: hypothetical protein KatS3mg120_0023 [Erythrobacter sp.]|nr:MAG: hypothetical protein KatS3mg120_0023 [Erythrobacter sp.]
MLENVVTDVRDAVDVTRRSAKPRGNVQIAAQAGSTDYSTRPGHLVLAHVRGLVTREVAFSEAATTDRRRAIIGIDVSAKEAGDGPT